MEEDEEVDSDEEEEEEEEEDNIDGHDQALNKDEPTLNVIPNSTECLDHIKTGEHNSTQPLNSSLEGKLMNAEQDRLNEVRSRVLVTLFSFGSDSDGMPIRHSPPFFVILSSSPKYDFTSRV